MTDPLEELAFLIGKWRGEAEDQFGEEGVVESTFEFTHEPSEKFIFSLGESRREGVLVNSSMSILMFDPDTKRFVRKSAFSYGWINNEVGEWKDDRLTLDIVGIDGGPEYFKGLRWRSFIQKYSEDEMGLGLEVAKEGEAFRPYGETRARRVNLP
ncbi:MAG: hypothetical protein ACE5IB_00835 [Candidatus Geothermarchaeales archaeon]